MLHGAVHVVVVGCGRVGSGLAVDLATQGHSVAIWTGCPAPSAGCPPPGQARQSWDRASTATISIAPGPTPLTPWPRSRAATTRTSSPLASPARITGIAHVVARIYDPRRAEIYQRLGIPTVATVTWTIDQVLRRLLPQTVTAEWTDSTGQMVLVEHLLPESWAGKRLDDLTMTGQASLVAVTRAGVPRLDVASMVGQEGDVLHVAVVKSAMNDLEKRIAAGVAETDPAEGRRRP